MKRIYMDYQAGSPVDPRVIEAMIPCFGTVFGNPSSTHAFGQEAKNAVDDARAKVASLIGAERKEDVVFTSGGTESNNLALTGTAERRREKGKTIVTSAIEHISILNICKHLSRLGFDVKHVPVDSYGMIDPAAVEKTISNDTILVSIMYANGEIGTIEPIAEISKIAHTHGAVFHVDAVAAVGKAPINVERENIDLLSLSSNDIYGPKGVGALYVKQGTQLRPIILGGGQERGLRSGTENAPGIVGMGKAAEITAQEMKDESTKLAQIRDRLRKGILDNIPHSHLNGHPTARLPSNLSVRFSYVEGESLVLSLDMEGIAVSSGSACSSKTLEPSHVLRAIGLRHEEAHGSLLFSLGRWNTSDEVDQVLGLLPEIVRRLRRMSPLTPKELQV
ncbi:cysteine desulfurase NifS [Candidatus Bathyarchaeota archaeon]|nr:cysteine desulfurase NifS [Candidatus Bathyarchaeota archaeon]